MTTLTMSPAAVEQARAMLRGAEMVPEHRGSYWPGVLLPDDVAAGKVRPRAACAVGCVFVGGAADVVDLTGAYSLRWGRAVSSDNDAHGREFVLDRVRQMLTEAGEA